MTPEPGTTTTIVVPAYNEEEGLPVVLEALQALPADAFEIVVVDDGSTDRTAEVARGFRCRLVAHARNRGKGAAIRTGVAHARGEKIVLIDADGTYPPEAVPTIAQALDVYDLVVGSRSLGQQHIPMLNRIGGFLFRAAIRLLYGFKGHDPLTGLYGIRKGPMERMRLGETGFGVESEITIKAARMGLRILDLPIEYRGRIGRAKLHPLRDGYRILRTILGFIMLYNPTVTFILPGLACLVLGVALMGVLLLGPVEFGRIAFGMHTTLIAVMLGLVGSQAIVFGVAVKLYALAHKFTMGDLVTDLAMRPGVRKALAASGLLSVLAGIAYGFRLVMDWVQGGFGDFVRTQEAELVSFLVIFGFQLLLSAGFIMIFAEELRSRDE
jgi:hypothetical protein